MEAAEAKQHGTRLRAAGVCLFGGILLVFLAFFGGDGGNMDVREYVQHAQQLWLKCELRLRDDPPVESRYALGLPFVAGPFVWAGQLLSLATGGAVHARSITALAVPVIGAAAAVLFFLWALSLGSKPRVACWAALLLAFSSPLLTYTQHFVAEVLVLFCVLMAVLSFVQARRAGKSAWLLATGLALGLMPMSHYSSAPTAAAFWVGMAAILLAAQAGTDSRFPNGRKLVSVPACLGRVALLTIGPLLAAAVFLGTNYLRYGQCFTTGYHVTFAREAEQFMRVEYVPRNLSVLGGWLLRTPWLLLSLAMLVLGLYFSPRRHKKLRSGDLVIGSSSERGAPSDHPMTRWPDHAIVLLIALAIVAQALFWLCYRDLYLMTNRYLLPMTGLWALGLPLLGQWLEARFPARGLAYTLVLSLVIGFAGFMRDDGIRAFYRDLASGETRCCAWYMQPAARATQFGTPCGPVQWLVLLALLAGGTVLLVRAWRLAGLSETTAERSRW